MQEGAAYALTSQGRADLAVGAAKGLIVNKIAEMTEMEHLLRSGDTGVLAKLENALLTRDANGKLTKLGMATYIPDTTENVLREWAYATGAMLARKHYPGLNSDAVATFANDMMQRWIGNYTPAQRPTLF